MVRKLLKHETKYYARTLFIYEIVLFTLAIFTRILMFFETDSIIYYLLQGSSFLLFGLAVFACTLMATIISVFRFYKNLFTSEGYLTFALPVSTNQHLLTKLFSAIVYNTIVFVSSIAAFLITISGEILNESVKAVIYIIKDFLKTIPEIPFKVGVHLVLYAIEIVAILLISVIFNQLLYYTCIAIGQTAKKNRILLAVAVYFGYMMLTEIFSTFLSIFMAVSVNFEFMQDIGLFIQNHPIATIHIFLCVPLLISVLITAACYVVTHVIISRKLNLE